MLAFSIYCISFAVQASTTVEITGTKFNKNQVLIFFNLIVFLTDTVIECYLAEQH